MTSTNSFAAARMRQQATKTTLVVEQQTFFEAPAHRAESDSYVEQAHHSDYTSSHMPGNSPALPDAGDANQSNVSTLEMLPPNFLQNEYKQDLSPDQRNPLDTTAASTVGRRIRRSSSSSRCAPHLSPAAIHSRSTVRPRLTLAPEDLLRIVDGIAASGLATERAERFAARASQEAAVATHEAARAARAVAELLGIPSQQLFKKALFNAESQPPERNQLYPRLKKTTAPGDADVGSVAEATVSLISDGDERMSSSESCECSPVASSHIRTDACTPRGKSTGSSHPHHFLRCDQGTKFLLASTKRRVLSPLTRPQNSGTQSEDWSATASDSPHLRESTPLATLALQMLFRLFPQSQARQQKLKWKLRNPDVQQSQYANPHQIPDIHSKDGQTCTGSNSPSAAVNFQKRIEPETPEGNSVVLHRGQGSLLTVHSQQIPSSEISSTLRKQSQVFVHNESGTIAEDRSHAPPRAEQLVSQTADPQCCALPCGKTASQYNDILYVVEQMKEDRKLRGAQPLSLEAKTRGPTCFPLLSFNSPTVSSTVMGNTRIQEADTGATRTVQAGDKEDGSSTEQGRYPRTERQGETKDTFSDRQASRRHPLHPPLGSGPCAAAAGFQPYCAMHLVWQSNGAAQNMIETSGNGDTETNAKPNKRTAGNAREGGAFREKKLARTACEDGRAETESPLEDFRIIGSHRDITLLQAESRGFSISPSCSREHCNPNRSTSSAISDVTVLPHNEDACETLTFDKHKNVVQGQDAYQLKNREYNCRERPSPQSRQGKKETLAKEHILERRRGGGDPFLLNPDSLAQPHRAARCHVSSSMSSSVGQKHAAGESEEAALKTRTRDAFQRQRIKYVHHALQEASSELKSSCAVDAVEMSKRVDSTFRVNTTEYDCEIIETDADPHTHDDRSRGPYPFLDELKMALLSRKNGRREQLQCHALKKERLEGLCYLSQHDEHCSGNGSPDRYSNSRWIPPRETLSSSSCLTSQGMALRAYVPTLSLLRAQQAEKEADTTNKDTGHTYKRAEYADFRMCRLEDAQGGKCRRVPEPKLASAPPGAAVTEHVQVGDRPLNSVNAAAFIKSDGQCGDCKSRFDGLHVWQNEALGESSLIESALMMQDLSIACGNANSGVGEDNTRDAENHSNCNATGRSTHAVENASTSQNINTTSSNSPYVGSNGRWGSTLDSACSPEKPIAENDRNICSSKATSKRCFLTIKAHSHENTAVPQSQLTESGVITEKATGSRSALQLFLQQFFLEGLDDSAGGMCSSDGKRIGLNGRRRPEEETGGQWNNLPDNLEDGAGDADSADTMSTTVEEGNGKYMSDVPGVSYRSAPHCGWRFRWKDHENGKEYSRCFSVNKFGFEEAKRQAESIAVDIRKRFPARRGTRWKSASGEAKEMKKMESSSVLSGAAISTKFLGPTTDNSYPLESKNKMEYPAP